MEPMPWQRQVSWVATEHDENGWCYGTVVLHVQRRAGKTGLMLPLVNHRCFTGADRAAWYTAQSRNDARDEWLQQVKMVRRSRILKPQLHIVRGAGTEAIEYPTGSAYRIFAPAEDSLHGRFAHLAVVDEAWAFDEAAGDALTQAIVPTFATIAGGGQLWILSAAGTSESSWLSAWVQRGRMAAASGVNRGLCYFEYGISDDVDPEDLEAVAAAHPAVGYTITMPALADAQAAMKPGEFARAFGGRWTATSERAIPATVWASVRLEPQRSLPRPDPGRVALAFDCDPEQTSAAIVAVWRDAVGMYRVEMVEARAGIWWVPQRLAQLGQRWRPVGVGYEAGGPAAVIADEVRRELLVELDPVAAGDYLAACAGFVAHLVNGSVRVHGHPGLDEAAPAAVRARVGDRWKWGRRASGGSIAGLVAATVGMWTLDHAAAPFEVL